MTPIRRAKGIFERGHGYVAVVKTDRAPERTTLDTGADGSGDPARTASEAGLRYVNDQQPGIRRRRCGRGFSYRDEEAGTTPSPAVLDRIRRLAIPPAWADVWICRNHNGHLQATGRDARGRKQYRYHNDWRTVRDANKFDRLVYFGTALGPLRRTVLTALDTADPPRETVLAAVVHLLDHTLIRVGSPEYAADNETFGLTTLREDHAEVGRRRVAFDFIGKHGQHHQVTVSDARLARVVRRCHELGGKVLFAFAGPDGEPVPISSGDVNDHLRSLTGADDVSAKDFRTWGGTVALARALGEMGDGATRREREANVLEAIDDAATKLHNTRAVCRQSYVHPAVVAAYHDGRLLEVWQGSRESRWYSRAEHATLRILGEAPGAS